MRLSSPILRAAAIALATTIATPAHAVDVVKAANTNSLNLGTSWVGGAAPGTSDTMVWNSTLTGANSSALGGNISVLGLKVINPGGAITVTHASGNTLTIGTGGIDMSAATQNLTLLSSANIAGTIAIGGNQTWNVASARTLQVFSNSNTANQRLTGSGNIEVTGGGIVRLLVGDSTSTGAALDGNGNDGFSGNWTITNGSFRTLRNGTHAWGRGTVTLKGGTVGQEQGGWMWSNDFVLGAGTSSAFDDFNTSGTTRALKLMGVISGSGNVTFKDSSARSGNDTGYVLTASNTLSGTVTLDTGADVRVGGVNTAGSTDASSSGTGGTLGTASVNLSTATSVLTLSRSDAFTFANTVSGAGVLRVGLTTSAQNTGVTTISGNNTHSGGTRIQSSATLAIGHASALGSGALIMSGNGNLDNALGSALTLSNDLQLSGGGLTFVGSSDLTLNGTTAISGANRTITVSAGTLTLGGAITQDLAGRALTKGGSGTLVIRGAAGYSGSTTISGGVLHLAGSGTLGGGSYAGAISNTASTLRIDTTAAQTLSGAITGAGALEKSASGTLTLGAANILSSTGSLAVSAGTLSLGGFAHSTGAVTLSGGTLENGTLTSTSGFTLTGGTVAANAILSGSVGLAKSGAGTATLNGTHAYNGATSVSEGTLVLASGASVASSAYAIATGGAVLQVDDGLTLGAGKSLSLSGAVGSSALTGNLTLSGGSIAIDFGAESGHDTLAIAGDLDLASGSIAFTKAGSYVGGTYAILSYTGAYSGDSTALTLSGLASDGTSRQTFNFLNDAGNKVVNLVVGGQAENVRWTGSAGSVWSAGGSGAANWLVTGNYGGDQPNRFFNGDAVTLDDNGTSGTLEIAAGGVTPGSVTVSAATLDYTIGGDGVITSGALSKSGAASLTLLGANTYAGGTILSAGRIRLGANDALGSGALAISGGALSSDGATARSLSNAVNLSGDATLGDATDSGVLTLSGAVDLGGSRGLTIASDVVLSGGVSGGALSKSGAGKLTLSAATTHTGGTTVSEGVLELGASNLLANSGAVTISGGTLAIGSNSDTIGALTLTSGSITGTGSLNAASSTFNHSGTVSVAAILSGNGTLSKSGNGTLVLSGANTFTGATTISGGTLELGNAAALGNTSAGTTVSAGGTLDLKGLALGAEALTVGGTLANSSGTAASHSGTVALASGAAIGGAGDITLSNVVSGSSLGFTKVGNGALILTAANTLSGSVAVSAGTLRFTGSGAIASASGVSVASGAILEWGRSGGFAPAVSGAGTVRRSTASGNAVFNGPNPGFTGTWEVNFLDAYLGFVGDAAVGGSSAGISLSNGGGFYFTATGNTLADTRTVTLGSGGGKLNGATGNTNTFAARFTGSGGLTKVSGEVAILTNPDNDFSGALAVNTGTIEIGGAGRLGSGSYAGAIAVGATFRVASTADQTLSGLMTGAGALQKQSSGTLTLSADNTFSGNVTVSGGTLRISGKLFAGAYNNASSITVSNGATLELASFAYDGVGSTGQLSDYAQRRVLSGGGIAVTGNSHSSGNNFSVANGSTGFFNVSAANQTLTLAGNGNSDILLGGALTVGGLGNLVINEVIANNTGTGSITKSGSGSLTLGAANTFGGGVTVQSGTLVLGNLSGFGSGTVSLTGGTLDLGGLVPTNVILLSGGSLANASAWLAANTPTLSGNIGAAEINNLGADIAELKVAAGATVNLSGVTKDIVFEGGTLSNLSGFQGKVKVKGSLDLSSEDPLGEVEVAAGGTVDFGARASSKTVKFTGGSVAGSNFTGTVEVVGSGVTLGSGIQAGTVRVTSGNSAAIASGFGRDISFAGGSLSGLANYSGTVSLETGATLSVGDTTSADFTLASGSTLKGSGSVGTITQTAGSVLAPGNSPGLLTTEALVLGAGSSLEVEFFAATGVRGTAYDAVTVTGALDLSGLSTGNRYTLNLVSLVSLPSTQGALAGFDAGTAYVYELFNYASLTLPASYTGNIASLFTIDKSLFQDADGNAVTGSFTVFRNDATNMLELQYTPIPEPSTYGLVLGGLALAGAAIRRRRAKRA